MTNKVCIELHTDNNYVIPTIVTIASILQNKKPESVYEIRVLTNNVTKENIHLIQKQLGNYGCVIPHTSSMSQFEKNHPYVSSTALFKFDLPDVLSDWDKVLYLDTDMIIQDDLSDLFNTDLHDTYIAAVADMAGMLQEQDHIRLNLTKYFNSGMMLMNLKKMRQDDIRKKLINYKLNQDCGHFMDQDCLNFIFNDKVLWLHPKYNFMGPNQVNFSETQVATFFNISETEAINLRTQAIIVHLTNKQKAWQYRDVYGSKLWMLWYKRSILKNKEWRYIDNNNSNIKLPQWFGRLVCCFIPKQKNRHNFRKKYITENPKTKFVYKERCSNCRRHIYFCGIKIASYIHKHKINNTGYRRVIEKNTNVDDFDFSVLWQMQRVVKLHTETFAKFKNIHCGQDVAVVATGPSLNDFKPIKNAIYIGVNKAFECAKIKLDYLFMQDFIGSSQYIEKSIPYKNKKLVRFYGIEPNVGIDNFIIPESIAIQHNALRYYCHSSKSKTPELPDVFAYDLCTEELYAKGSTVFSAVQFALWTNPKKIYLVGCDCSNNGHFDNSKSENLENLIIYWKELKKFISIYYPNTEIISINPVGLRGLFTDLDQKE